jgi:cytochrome c2
MNRNSMVMLIGGLALPAIAALGGWATISVKDVPDYMVAGQPTQLAFRVLQHGAEPLSGLQPTIVARLGTLAATADAKPTGKGDYAATLNLTQPGDWTLTINSGFGKSRVTLVPIPVVASAGQHPQPLTEAQRGERLFAAKGCTTCHVEFESGPKLAGRSFDPGYLKRWLTDPQTAKPGARMPNQELKPAEIAALTAFLNQSAHGTD